MEDDLEMKTLFRLIDADEFEDRPLNAKMRRMIQRHARRRDALNALRDAQGSTAVARQTNNKIDWKLASEAWEKAARAFRAL